MNTRPHLPRTGWRRLLILLVCLLLSASPVFAHGYLMRSIPDNRAVLERAPTRLHYWFSEALEPEFSDLTVRNQAGHVIASGAVSEDDDSLLTARLPADLPDGAYVAELRIAFASDGHVVVESRVFFVGDEVAGVEGQAASSQANTLEVIWRALAYASTLLLFGALTLYSGVLTPAWGSHIHSAGLLPPRVMQRLSWLVIAALVVAFVSNGIALIQQAMMFFNTDAAQVLSEGYWQIVRIGSRFGDVWNVRMLLLTLVALLHGISLFYRDVYPETVRPFWMANTWAAALVLGTWSAASHAAGSTLWPWLAIAADWLHLLAVGFWMGGLAALVVVLPAALRPYTDEERRLALLAALSRFSRVAVFSVAVVVATGIFSAANWLNTPADVVQTSYGTALVAKVILVGALLLAGLTHYIALRPERFRRWSALIAQAQTFSRTLRIEAVLVMPVLLAAALLSATPVPIPVSSTQPAEAPVETQTVGDWTVTMTLTPGGPGVNTYDILVESDDARLAAPEVGLQIVNPVLDRRNAWQEAEPVDGGLYVSAGDEIDQTGTWWALVDVTAADGTVTRAAFDWNISDEAVVNPTRTPGVVNLLALAGLIGAVSWVVYPFAYRFFRRLDLSPASVTIAAGFSIATILFVVVGVFMIQNAQAQYDATLNPPPQVVNTVLPDEASLGRGQALYETRCVGWDDVTALVDRRTRDEAIFAAVADGWRTLPACDGVLSDEQRWDVVNFLRTLEEGQPE
jgi:copper transport protein